MAHKKKKKKDSYWKLMVLKISWTAWLGLQNGQPTKLKESIGVGTGVEPANEPPITLSIGSKRKVL